MMIPCRDPFILLHNGTYYLYRSDYATGVSVLTSDDLEHWSEPCLVLPRSAAPWAEKELFWSPECHEWRGKFYLITSFFHAAYRHRVISIYRADRPDGPFTDICGGHISSTDWDAIDGTLYVDRAGKPWLVFVHEWTCMPEGNGAMAAVRLSDDFTHTVGEPIELFKAKEPAWATEGVTDGPFLWRTADGVLWMIWSNFGERGYVLAAARSESGGIEGPWIHEKAPLYQKGDHPAWIYDGGHGMILRDKEGALRAVFHSPNDRADGVPEHVVILPLIEEENGLRLGEK